MPFHLFLFWNVQFKKVSILPTWKFFLFCTPSLPPPPPKPPGNSSLVSYFTSKILTLKTSLPPGICNDLLWGGYGFFSGIKVKQRPTYNIKEIAAPHLCMSLKLFQCRSEKEMCELYEVGLYFWISEKHNLRLKESFLMQRIVNWQ